MKKGNFLTDFVRLKNIYNFIRKKNINKNNVYQNYIMGNSFTENKLDKNFLDKKQYNRYKENTPYNLYVNKELIFK